MTFSNFLCAVVLGLVLLSQQAVGQTPTQPGKHLAGFNYAEVVLGDSSDKRLPVLIALHYSSSSTAEVFQFYDSIGTDMRIILPRGNYRKRQGHSWFPPDHYSKDSTTQIETTRHTVDSVAAFIRELYQKYPVKPVVSGLSQGGDISLLLALRYPQLLKASLPMLGFVHREAYTFLKKSSTATIPIHLVHGEADKIVSINYVRKQTKYLQKIFKEITFSSYAGVEHDVTPAMERDYNTKLQAWLKR
jgi:phospholipase/carboxylesterase